MKRLKILIIAFASLYQGSGQTLETPMSLTEYLAYVKSFHPLVKQANLLLDEAEAELLEARGAFDPKFDLSIDRKNFEGTEYFDRLNSTFKIPTWYGVTLEAGFEQNEGSFLNPEFTVPDEGLVDLGVSVSLGRGLWIDERMATLKQAKLFQQLV